MFNTRSKVSRVNHDVVDNKTGNLVRLVLVISSCFLLLCYKILRSMNGNLIDCVGGPCVTLVCLAGRLELQANLYW